MQVIRLGDVIIPEERQRTEIAEDYIVELAHDILKPHGLLHAIVLRNDGRTLAAGECRLRAFFYLYKDKNNKIVHNGEEVPIGYIPYTRLCDLSEIELRECELSENLKRSDLSWQERAQAIADLHALRVELDPNHTVKDTTKEIFGTEKPSGRKQKQVQDAIDMSEFLDDPMIEAAPDMKTARKVIKTDLQNKERQERLQDLSQKDTVHKLILGSSYNIENMDKMFDVILMDPPYGIGIDTKDTFDDDEHDYDDSDNAFDEILEKVPDLAAKIAKDQAHLYCFCDIRRFMELWVAFELAGWSVRPKPLIWDKGNIGSYGNIEYDFRACYDAILFANRGKKPVTAGYRDVIPINQRTDLAHPAGKPIELFSELLKRSVMPGDHVADLFCGSGPIFPAAQEHNAIAYGWETNPKYHAMAAERLHKIIET